jgi:hypothetical protein
MARPQQYRGNPELKQYILFDNFSGGINTTSIDDQTYTNEFRLLKNVDLKEQGRIQNRKGFGYFNVFNQLTDYHDINIFDGTGKDNFKIRLVKVMRDTHNILDRMSECETIQQFNTLMLGTEYMFDIVVARSWTEEVTPITFNIAGITSPLHRVITSTSLVITSGTTTISNNFGMTVGQRVFNYYNNRFYQLTSGGGSSWTFTHLQAEGGAGSAMPDDGFSQEAIYLDTVNNVRYRGVGSNPHNTSLEIIDSTYELNDMFADVVSLKIRNPLNVATMYYNSSLYRSAEDTGLVYREVKLEEKLIGLNSFIFDESLYFSLHELIPHDSHTGIIKITVSEDITPSSDEFELINNDNYYRPSPYELSYVGFNTISNNPFDFTVDGALSEIRGAFITHENNDNMILSNIPTSGKFNFNVIYNGNIEPSILKLDIYTQDGFGEKQALTYSVNTTGVTDINGIIKYPITLAVTDLSEEIYLKVYQEVSEVITSDVIFDTTDEMLAQFGRDAVGVDIRPNVMLRKTSVYANLYTRDTAITYGYKFITLPSYSGTFQSLNDPMVTVYVPQKSGNILVPIVDSIDSNWRLRTTYPDYKNTWAHILRPSAGGYKLMLGYFDQSGKIKTDFLNDNSYYIVDAWTEGSLIEFTKDTTDLSHLVPNTVYIYQIGTVTPTYYKLKTVTIAGTIADFTLITPEVEEILSYIDIRTIASNELKEIRPINLANIKLLEINNRAVIYTGNTILFSDMFNFKYFPNYNYIVLPLVGGDSIQKMAYFRGSWIIFTKQRIYRMSGEFATPEFKIVLINDSIGCTSPDSVRSINNNLIFMTRDGLYTIKQNYYMEGLENVEKIDKQIRGLIPYGENYESIIYNEQYWLIIKDERGNYLKTIKMYYNMEYASKTHPYVVDEYAKPIKNMFLMQNRPYSVYEDRAYIFDQGYLDFSRPDETEAEREDNMYKLTILTPNWSLGMPTHEKKFKNIYIKTDSKITMPVYITLYVDNNVWSTPYEYVATVNELGEIEYNEILNKVSLQTTEENIDNIVIGDEALIETIDPDLVLGSFTLGVSTLGLNKYQVHKVITSAKGKVLKIQIEQKTPSYFAIDSIGILYKLGKARESR